MSPCPSAGRHAPTRNGPGTPPPEPPPRPLSPLLRASLQAVALALATLLPFAPGTPGKAQGTSGGFALPFPGALPLAAQAPDTLRNGAALRLMVGNTGVGIGHVPRVNGVRVNWSDRHLEVVNGVNLTLWRARSGSVGGLVRGGAVGLAPQAGTLQGIGLGVAAVIGEEALKGAHAGGLAVVASGPLSGVSAGGLAVVAEGGIRGVSLGGLATVAEGGIQGIQAGGLAVVGGGGIRGVQAGGLAVVSDGPLRGIQGGGLAVVSDGPMDGWQVGGLAVVSGAGARGIQLGGLAVVADGVLDGIQLGGLAVVSGEGTRGLQAGLAGVESGGSVDGITLAGYRIRAPQVRGVAGASYVDAGRFQGVSVAGLHRLEVSVGLTVGVVNWADELRGVQLGLLNRAGNNPPPFRVLPLLNAHF